MKRRIGFTKTLVMVSFFLLAACQSVTMLTKTPRAEILAEATGKDATLPTAEKVKIRWFIGVDTGKDPAAVSAANAFVQKFNDSQGRIELELEVVTSSTHAAIDQLLAEIETGNPPDVIAPADMGWAGEQLSGRLLPLDAALFDLANVDSKVLDAWRVEGTLIGLPAGVFPSTIFYNRDLFDAAGLPYPPHKFGEPYADGDPWTIEKMETIALKLTRDANGLDATATDFDPALITQWGFHWQWDSTRSMAVMFGAGSVVDENGNAIIPQPWREAYHWYYDGMWQKRFIPTTAQVNAMQGNPFKSGKVAMVHTFMWYAPRLVNDSNWDLAAVPDYQGLVTTRMQRDGVFVLNTTQHPEEAFEVAYAIATSPELLLAWEMVPVFQNMQSSFMEGLQAKHPGVDWQVMLDSIAYADTTYENTMPNYRQAYDRLLAFRDLIGANGTLSLDAEIDRLESDLDDLFK